MTTSQVDITFPADNVQVSKATMRAQYVIIKDELDVLFAKVGEAGRLAFGFVTKSDVTTSIRNELSKSRYARDNLAFTWSNL